MGAATATCQAGDAGGEDSDGSRGGVEKRVGLGSVLEFSPTHSFIPLFIQSVHIYREPPLCQTPGTLNTRQSRRSPVPKCSGSSVEDRY